MIKNLNLSACFFKLLHTQLFILPWFLIRMKVIVSNLQTFVNILLNGLLKKLVVSLRYCCFGHFYVWNNLISYFPLMIWENMIGSKCVHFLLFVFCVKSILFTMWRDEWEIDRKIRENDRRVESREISIDFSSASLLLF